MLMNTLRCVGDLILPFDTSRTQFDVERLSAVLINHCRGSLATNSGLLSKT